MESESNYSPIQMQGTWPEGVTLDDRGRHEELNRTLADGPSAVLGCWFDELEPGRR